MLNLKEKFRQLPWGMSPWPGTKDDAILENAAKYYPDPSLESCPRHGVSAVRYTATGIWGCCAVQDSIDAYNSAAAAGLPTGPGEAHAAGLDFYWRPEPGLYCGHIGMKTLSGKCYTCEMERISSRHTPRQRAMNAGEVWYQPDPGDLCKHGHNAPRRVSNGSCKACEEAANAERAESRYAPLWRVMPDIIISRDDAKAKGMNVYRTGKPCRRGHTSWRYVSTNGCLECLGKIK